MPQLDKLSFATQYFWLTIFFFGLYFLTTNFFVILVFKNLKLRNIVYKIWYFFLYNFDYNNYHNKSKSIVNACFNTVYYSVYINFYIMLKLALLFSKISSFENNTLLSFYSQVVKEITCHNYIKSSYSTEKLKNLEKINIDEI